MKLRRQIKFKKRCQRQNLRLFKQIQRRYFEGSDKDYNRVIACLTAQYKQDQEDEAELRGRT